MVGEMSDSPKDAAWIPAIRYRPPDASYLAWVDCTALGLGDDPSAVFLAKGRVALSSGPSAVPLPAIT